MNAPSCHVTFSAHTLIAYWLGELDGHTESEFEEHLFGCASCTKRLRALVELDHGVRRITRDGNVRAVLAAPFVQRLKEFGARVREYRVHAGSSVACTVTPQDDLVVAHLHAPLQDVKRLDIVMHDLPEDTRVRIEDVAFDPSAGELVMLPNVVQLRQLTFATQHVTLLSVEPTGERVIGDYTFNHSPHA
jgi:anti-sigma factor RsiW